MRGSVMEARPRFLQGTINFVGKGLKVAVPLPELSYTVPMRHSAQVVYFRAGNSSDDLVNLTLLRDGRTMRLFPLGMKSAMHFPLAIQEKLPPATRLELTLCAAEGVSGSLFVDLGLMEQPAAPTAMTI